jgi:hypothetical protein
LKPLAAAETVVPAWRQQGHCVRALRVRRDGSITVCLVAFTVTVAPGTIAPFGSVIRAGNGASKFLRRNRVHKDQDDHCHKKASRPSEVGAVHLSFASRIKNLEFLNAVYLEAGLSYNWYYQLCKSLFNFFWKFFKYSDIGASEGGVQYYQLSRGVALG